MIVGVGEFLSRGMAEYVGGVDERLACRQPTLGGYRPKIEESQAERPCLGYAGRPLGCGKSCWCHQALV